MQIHYPGFSVFGAMQNARFLHLVSAYIFVAIGVYHTYIFFAARKHRIGHAGALRLLGGGAILKYYLRISREKPAYEKYNVLQKYGYFLLFAVSILQTLLGFALYPYFLRGVFSFVFAIFGDAVQIRIWHTTIMWLFISFTALHVYLVVTRTGGWSRRWWTGTTTGRSRKGNRKGRRSRPRPTHRAARGSSLPVRPDSFPW